MPGILNKKGVTGVILTNYPSSFGALLNNQTGIICLTSEAILTKSKHNVYLAMLADPIVDNADAAEKTLNTMIDLQKNYLGYLK